MNIKDFNEALYASSNGVVVERRRDILIPIIILLVGAAMLVANSFIESGENTNNLKSALILFGGLIALVGVVYSATTIFGNGSPYHIDDKCFLVQKQYLFERAQIDAVVKAVECGDKKALDAIKEGDIAALTVVCCYSPKSSYCVMQAYAYEDFVYNSITKLVIKS